MYTATAARNRFSAGNLEGVSGPRIVVMCFERVERDLAEAITAIEASDHYQANAALCHAQDLIAELALMVDAAAWEHAGTLLALYDYLLRLLPVANMKKDPNRINEAMRHVVELGAAFRQAERSLTTPAPLPQTEVEQSTPRRISVQA
jgi:flagellar secretion chaperone FliS